MKREKSEEGIHDQVAKTYARALERARSGSGGCCGSGSSAQSGPFVTGVAARTAGYAEELAQVPADAASASFGCGNPVAFAGLRPGDTVLDLGSGAGLDLILAARKVGAEGRVIGVDMTDEMIAAARRNIAEAEYVAGLEREGLSDVRVRDRLVYDETTLKGIVDSDLGDLGIDASGVDASDVGSKIARIAGRVQSVRLEGSRSV